jgi:hypothetical protein
MRKAVMTALVTAAMAAGLAATSGVALAGDNNGIGNGGGDTHSHSRGGLVGGLLGGGVLSSDGGTCNGVTVASSCRGPRVSNAVGGNPGFPSWYPDGYGFYPSLYHRSYLNLGQYGYRTPVDVCGFDSFPAFERWGGPRLGRHFGELRSRFGANRGAWDTGWARLREEGSCTPQFVERPGLYPAMYPALYTAVPPNSADNPAGAAGAPGNPVIPAGDGTRP